MDARFISPGEEKPRCVDGLTALPRVARLWTEALVFAPSGRVRSIAFRGVSGLPLQRVQSIGLKLRLSGDDRDSVCVQ